MTKDIMYIDQVRLAREQSILEKKELLELLRVEVVDEYIDLMLGDQVEDEQVNIARTKIAEFFLRGILEYERRRMALHFAAM